MMKLLLAAVALSVVLAGCSGSRFQQEEVAAAPPASTTASQDTSPVVSQIPIAFGKSRGPSNRRAEERARQLDGLHNRILQNQLLAKVAARFRPKWCANFREPI